MPTNIETMSRNRLLARLSGSLADEFAGTLREVTLKQYDVVFQRGAEITSVYFPIGSLISLVVDLRNGNTVEALTVGNDGFAEPAAFLGKRNASFKGIVQISGPALVMPIESFRPYTKNSEFRQFAGDYVDEALSMVAQSSACLAFHPVEQRLARWLLEVRDRVDVDDLDLTQEFLAQMLGVQRPTASIAVKMLVNADLISHRRGSVAILDRPALEDATCECYRTARDR
jgi:CRP-like cAMP-binding protein